MGKLTGQSIASSYDQLLIVDNGDGINNNLQALESADTDGAVSALKIATDKVEVIPSANDNANAFEVSKADGTAIITADSSAETVDIAGHDASAKGLKLGGTLVTATAAELNALDGGASTGGDTITSTSNVIVDIGGTTQKKSVEDLQVNFEDYFARMITLPLWNASSPNGKYAMNSHIGSDLNDCETLFNFSDLGTTSVRGKLYVHVTSSTSGGGYNFQIQFDNQTEGSNQIFIDITNKSVTTIDSTFLYESAVFNTNITGLTKLKLHGWNGSQGATTEFNKAWFWVAPNA
tara:strand:- start:799 stop:1674 length:876 start_codon:yes stop_codon:yes gene_type:complete